jgi:bifunctional DNase/RNase
VKNNSSTELLRVIGFEPLITETDGFEMGALNCILENGDVITLYNVPLEIVRAIAKLLKEDELESSADDSRDTIYEVLIMVQPKLKDFRSSIREIVIDDFNKNFGTYSASIYMNVDGISLKRSLIPSHAIFLALLFDKPVYVTRRIAEISKELENEEGFDLYEGDDEF